MFYLIIGYVLYISATRSNYLNHALEQAGASHLMTSQLKETLAEHSAGNIRVLNNMAAELLATGAQKQVKQLDEKLFLEIFSRNSRN